MNAIHRRPIIHCGMPAGKFGRRSAAKRLSRGRNLVSISSRVATILARRDQITYSPTDDDHKHNFLSELDILNYERQIPVTQLRSRSPINVQNECERSSFFTSRFPSPIPRLGSRSFIPIDDSRDNINSSEIWFSSSSREDLRYFEHDLNSPALDRHHRHRDPFLSDTLDSSQVILMREALLERLLITDAIS